MHADETDTACERRGDRLRLGRGAGPAREEQVEVIHWWTSGGEAAALQVLRANLEKEGVSWKDAAIAGGGGDQARTVLQARMAAGNPPTAMQMLGLSSRTGPSRVRWAT